MSRKVSLRGAIARGVFPHQLSWLLELPLRRLLVSPDQIADRSGLRPSSAVLELGCGSGFFSRHLARRVHLGRLELLDVQFDMLRKARKKLRGFSNIGYTAADATQLPYTDAEFDVVIMVSVLGEVPQPEACLNTVHRVLRPSGWLLCHESVPDPDFVAFRDLVEFARTSKLVLERRWGNRWNYTAAFRRGRPATSRADAQP